MGKNKPVITRYQAAELVKDGALAETCTFELGGLKAIIEAKK